MYHIFLENWYLYVSTFKFRGGTSLPNSYLSTPPEIPIHLGTSSLNWLPLASYFDIVKYTVVIFHNTISKAGMV